jgi:hypothetical protein
MYTYRERHTYIYIYMCLNMCMYMYMNTLFCFLFSHTFIRNMPMTEAHEKNRTHLERQAATPPHLTVHEVIVFVRLVSCNLLTPRARFAITYAAIYICTYLIPGGGCALFCTIDTDDFAPFSCEVCRCSTIIGEVWPTSPDGFDGKPASHQAGGPTCDQHDGVQPCGPPDLRGACPDIMATSFRHARHQGRASG